MLSLFNNNHNNPFRAFDSLTIPFSREVEKVFEEPLRAFDDIFEDMYVPSISDDIDIDNDNDDELLSKIDEDNENVYYEKKVMVNNNGHVKVKTIEKEPGSAWNVRVKEYTKGSNKKAIKNDTTDKALKVDSKESSERSNVEKSDKNNSSNNINNEELEANEFDVKKFALRRTPHGKRLAAVSKKTSNKKVPQEFFTETIMKDFESIMDEVFEGFDMFRDITSKRSKVNDDEGQSAMKKTPKKIKKSVNTLVEEDDKDKSDDQAKENKQFDNIKRDHKDFKRKNEKTEYIKYYL